MAYKEKDFQSDFTAWIRHERNKGNFDYSFAFELKISDSQRLAFSKIEPHQYTSLKRAALDCVYHKISDQSLSFKPFDGFQICRVPAFLIILFYEPRKPKEPVFIPILKLLEFMEKNPSKKSITKEEAISIGTKHQMAN